MNVLYTTGTFGNNEVTQVNGLPVDSLLARRWYRNLYSVGSSYWAQTSAGLTEAKNLAKLASESGYNGILVPIHYYFLTWNTATKDNFKSYIAYCQSLGMEVVPDIFAINGCGMLFNRNFAEADPIDSMILVAGTDSLRPAPATSNLVLNGGLESYSGNTFTQYRFQDQAGICTFADNTEKFQGNASIRFDNFAVNPTVRLCQHIILRPNYQYRCRFMLKKSGCPDQVMVLVNGSDYANEIQRFTVSSSKDLPWTQYSFEFTTSTTFDIKLYLGTWEGTTGKFWIDNIEITESSSLSNIIRRKGTPLSIKSLDGKTTYTEGIDFDSIPNVSALSGIKIKSGSAIKNNQQVQFSCYRASDYNGFKAICMSNEAIYPFFGNMARQVYALYPFKKVFLYVDEIRCAGSCYGCISSGKSTGQILGECVARLHDSIKAINPSIEVITWADMFDPLWNARNHYYKVVGDLTGSCNYLPGDLTIIPWGDCGIKGSSSNTKLKNSLDYFAGKGFNVMGCGYYDKKTLDGTSNWINLLLNCQKARGLIYATWKSPPDFSQLAGFGKLITDSIKAHKPAGILSLRANSDLIDITATPNPFKSATSIHIIMNTSGYIMLDVFRIDGSYLRKLVSQNLNAGSHTFIWNGDDDRGNIAPPGVYICRLIFGGSLFTKKVVIAN